MFEPLSRRTFIVATSAGVAQAAAGITRAAQLAAPFWIDTLLVDGIANPVGVHRARNRLSWQLLSRSNRVRQTAYRIGVASSEAGARSGAFDLWDSGRVESSRSFDIAYAGKSLASRERAFWVVAAWDEAGVVATSTVARWEMGLLAPEDWVGQWVAAEDAVARADRLAGFHWVSAPAGSALGARVFRWTFQLPVASTVTLFVATSFKAVASLDDQPLALPPHNPNAWGPPQPARIDVPLAAGRHVVVVGMPAHPGPKAALLVRATGPDGAVTYIDEHGAETRVGRVPLASAAAPADDNWAPAIVMAGADVPLPAGSAYLLRREFSVRGRVASARLYVTALGVYEAELNGSRLGDALLTPEFTDYRKRVLYGVHDVTAQLREGANVIGGSVGEGWYGSNVAPSGRYSFGPAPLRLLAQLEITYADGRRQVVVGDDQWQVSRAPITASGIYDGEDYDARLEQPGWSAPGFTANAPRWERATVAPGLSAECRLVGAVVPPVRRVRQLSPKSIKQFDANRCVVDFGQNFAGWVRLRARGPAGQQLTLRFAELVNADGSVDQSNLRAARATDRYTLRGDPAGERYEPRFTYHGFRYVEIEGLSAPLRAQDIAGIVIHSALAETGQLTLDQHVPQQMWQNALWSQRSNFVGIPTDCPQRDERLGWMGDAHVFWDAAAYNMDVAAFTSRFMSDVEDAQHADGGYADFAPDAASGRQLPAGSAPGWADAGIILPWTVWWRYGDTGIIDAHWESMQRFMDSILRTNPDLIWAKARGNDYADWLALDAKRPGDPTTPKDLVGTAMWKAASDAMAAMAEATGRSADVDRYRTLSAGLMQAFVKAYVKDDGSVGNGSQTGYIQALQFDLLPPALRTAAARHLVADIRRRGTLLSTGFLGTPYSLDVLANAGEPALACDLLLRTGYPSWGYMIDKGATTIWERWNGDAGDRSMNSFNHYALGAVAGFLFRRIAGIDATAPGFARFRFDPVLDPRFQRGAGRYQSRSGLITTRWQRDARGGFRLELQVPPNTEANVVLPARDLADVRDGARRLSAVRGVQVQEGVGGGQLALRVASGRYDFRVGGFRQ